MGDKEDARFFIYGKPIDIKPTVNSLTINQRNLDALDGNYSPNYFKPSTASISLEVKVTKQALRKLFPRPHLPRKKKKALKKMMMPYAENMFELFGERKQRYVTLNRYIFWIKVERNKFMRKSKK